MRTIIFFLFLALLSFSSCQNKKNENHYSGKESAIQLKTIKHKGRGLFENSGWSLFFKQPKDHLFDFNLPEKLDSIEIATLLLDIKPDIYEKFKIGRMDTTAFNNLVVKFDVDTLNLPKQEIKKNYLSILRAYQNDTLVFMIDQNNNRDFTDDTIRNLKNNQLKADGYNFDFEFDIFNDKEIVTSHSWVKVVKSPRGSRLAVVVNQHVSAKFTMDGKSFTIGVADDQGNCSFDEIVIALLEDNGVKKDTLTRKDYFKRGEYLKLGEHYYKFQDITNDGSLISLIKEDDFKNKVGTQVGMLAPEFTCKTLDNQSRSLKNYKGSYLLLANLSSCWGYAESYTHYKAIGEQYASQLRRIGIDYEDRNLIQKIKELKLKGEFVIAEANKGSFQEAFRPGYSSRNCFLIDPDGRIVSRFDIENWKSVLSKQLD
ncbi:peroxiredoxin family protein [Ancylomarina sp. YFZ004]